MNLKLILLLVLGVHYFWWACRGKVASQLEFAVAFVSVGSVFALFAYLLNWSAKRYEWLIPLVMLVSRVVKPLLCLLFLIQAWDELLMKLNGLPQSLCPPPKNIITLGMHPVGIPGIAHALGEGAVVLFILRSEIRTLVSFLSRISCARYAICLSLTSFCSGVIYYMIWHPGWR